MEENTPPHDLAQRLIVIILFVCILFFALRSNFVPILDNTNLLLHEAGHLLFGIIGWPVLAALGGTIMQLLLPFIFAGYFWTNGNSLGTQVGIFWTGQNLVNIGHYMADANAQVLPLLGAGEHDWNYLFGSFNLLVSAEAIGMMVHFTGIGLMLIVTFLTTLQIFQSLKNQR